MKNKKGFTLIELLAIIVILAVIMVIAVPKILDIVNGSKNSAWKNNVGMIKKAIVTNSQLVDVETGSYKYSIDKLCLDPSKVKEIVKLEDTNVTCSNNVFTLTGTGQFEGKKATITCTNKKCSVNIINTNNKSLAGLYDANDNQLASWDELVNTYGMNLNWADFSNKNCQYIDEEMYEGIKDEAAEFGVTGPGMYCWDEELGKAIAVSGGIPVYQTFNNDKLKSAVKLVVPDFVNHIPKYALMNIKNIKSIVFSGNIEIAEGAFEDSTGIEYIVFNGNVKAEKNAFDFESDSTLKQLTFGTNVSSMEFNESFHNLEAIEKVEFLFNPFGWKFTNGAQEMKFPPAVFYYTFDEKFNFRKSFLYELKIVRDTSVTTQPLANAGLYDSSNQLIASWSDIFKTYKADLMFSGLFGGPDCVYMSDTSLYFDIYKDKISYVGTGWYCYSNESKIWEFYNIDSIESNQPSIIIDKLDKRGKGTKLIVDNTIDMGDLMDDYFDFSFTSLRSVEEIVLPDNLRVIYPAMFGLSSNLKTINIPNSVEYIGAQAFAYTKIKQITIPSSVTAISYMAFTDMSSLNSITIADPNGWSVRKYNASESDPKTPISASDLSNPAIVKQYLTDTYSEYNWYKD